jgi:tetratricopeptide (TPR) repeat protein
LLTEVLEQESAGEYSLARIHRLEAERLQAAGEVEGAAEHALRAAQAAPRSTPELVLFTIQALTRAGRRVDALHLVESALLDLPHVVSLEAERADLLVALGRTGDALEWLDRLVEEAARSRQFARQARWLERKGDLLLATGSSGAAAAAYQEALRALKPARRIPASTAQRLEASRLSAEEAAAAGGTFEPRGGLLENRR